MKRWPLQKELYEADLWLEIVTAESATEDELSQVATTLKKMLTYRNHEFNLSQAALMIKIAQADLPVEYKRSLLSVYEDPAAHFVPWKKPQVKNQLKKIEDHPEVGDIIKEMNAKW